MLKKFFVSVVALALLTGIANAEDALLVPKWYYPASGIIEMQARDLDSDGGSEVILRFDDSIYVLGGNGTLKWNFKASNKITSFFISDLNRDGYLETVVASGITMCVPSCITNSEVTVLDHKGRPIPEQKFDIDAQVNAVSAGDMDNDKFPELVLGTLKKVYLFDPYGHKKWDFRIQNPAKELSVVDLDSDGYNDVVVTSDRLYAIDRNGNAVLTYDAGAINRTIELRLLVGNFMGDKASELALVRDSVITLFGVVRAHTITLKTNWEYSVGAKVRMITPMDYDSDGYSELMVGSADGNVHLVDNDGTKKWTYQIAGDVTGFAFLDLDNDGGNELIIATTKNVYAFDKSLTFEWRQALEENDTVATATFSDMDADNYIDIAMNVGRGVKVLEVNQVLAKKQLADGYYARAEDYYIESAYNVSVAYIAKAKKIYLEINETVGIARCDALSKRIEEKTVAGKRDQADDYYDKAQNYFITEDYDLAMTYAEKAEKLYVEIGERERAQNVRLLIMAIDRKIKEMTQTTVASITTPTTISIVVPTEENNTWKIIAAIVALAVLLLVGYKKKREADLKMMEKWEKTDEELVKIVEDSMK